MRRDPMRDRCEFVDADSPVACRDQPVVGCIEPASGDPGEAVMLCAEHLLVANDRGEQVSTFPPGM